MTILGVRGLAPDSVDPLGYSFSFFLRLKRKKMNKALIYKKYIIE